MSTVNIAYAASSVITITLASIATSATFVAGAESTIVDNTSNKYVDAIVGGKITVGTTPTVNTQILVYVFTPIDSTPTYPDVMDGTDSVETLTSVGVGRGFLKLGAVLDVDAVTSNIAYPFSFTVAALFGGVMPSRWGLFVAHNTGVNLHATGGNHVIKYEGITYTVV
jgi:hypothetical protein